MSSNVVKSFYTIKESSVPRVINSNSVVEELFSKISIQQQAGMDIKEFPFEQLGDDTVSDGFDGLFENNSVEGTKRGDAFDDFSGEVRSVTGDDTNGVSFVSERNVAVPNIDIEAERKRLIDEANAEATMMKNLALEEIARDKSMAIEMGRKEGYEAGMAQAEAELEQKKAELELLRKKLAQEYEDKIYELEPQFVRHITNIYEKVFQIELSGKKEIVLNVLKGAIQKIEGTKNYIVHVSKDDYSFVNEHKSALIEASLTADVIIDIVEDMTMRQGDCMIETANGIFDCGIDTQLSAIRKRLALLSYDGR